MGLRINKPSLQGKGSIGKRRKLIRFCFYKYNVTFLYFLSMTTRPLTIVENSILNIWMETNFQYIILLYCWWLAMLWLVFYCNPSCLSPVNVDYSDCRPSVCQLVWLITPHLFSSGCVWLAYLLGKNTIHGLQKTDILILIFYWCL